MMYKLSFLLLCLAATSNLRAMPMADIPALPLAQAPASASQAFPVAAMPMAPVQAQEIPQQPAAQALPVIQPPTSFAVTPAQMAPPALPVSAESSQEQIITAMKNSIETISSIKKEIKASLNELDDKLLEAKKIASEGKNMSMALLQQSDPAIAQAEFSNVQRKLSSLKETESLVTGPFTQNFNQKISSFNSAVSKLQAFAQTLRTLVPQPEVQATAMATQAATTPEITIKPDRSFFTMLTDMLSSIIAHVISGLKKIKDLIQPNHQTDDSQKKTLNTMAQTQTTVISPEIVKEAINLFDAIIQSLEIQQLSFVAQLQTLKQIETSVSLELKKSKIIINFDEFNLSDSVTFKKFTTIVHTIFASVFHAFIWIVSNIIDLAKQAYSEHIRPLLTHITKDVKNKVKDLEHPNEISQPAQPIINSQPQVLVDNNSEGDDNNEEE